MNDKKIWIGALWACCLYATSTWAQDPSAKLDALVLNRLKQTGVQPNPTIDAVTFLRRAYLNIVGRIPAVTEVDRFMASDGPGKRRKLVEELLGSREYAMHEVNYWSDVLRARTKNGSGVTHLHGEVYLDWIKQSLHENKPFDRFVYEMLSFVGGGYDDGGGAYGYYKRDLGMPLNNVAFTMQVFLGARIECAQCHDDSVSSWTQREFYELAAFSDGLIGKKPFTLGFNNRRKDIRNPAPRVDKVFNRVRDAFQGSLFGTGRGVIRLPFDFDEDDGKPNEIVTAQVPFGEPVAIKLAPVPEEAGRKKGYDHYPQNDSRIVFAKWLTSHKNDRFARMLANRMWKRVTGTALIEPVDRLDDGVKASDPKLMEALVEVIRANNYKLKDIYRVLYSMQLFQRASVKGDVIYSKTMGFPGPAMRRMSAEQVWDSMMVLRSDAVGQFDAPAQQFWPYSPFYKHFSKLNDDQIVAEIQRLNDEANVAGKSAYDYAKDKFSPKWETRVRGLVPSSSLRRGPERAVLSGPISTRYVRASELAVPASSDHFLYRFGQSQRELIEASSQEATMPQSLTMMNGLDQLLYPGTDSGVWRAVSKAPTPEQKVKVLFRATLTRAPTEKELMLFQRIVGMGGEKGVQDAMWILLNTHEFKFIR
jgi:hypothetical protein